MTKPVSYKRHRFPPEIIAHAVWLYFRFPLSLRLVEEMLLERGILVSYETVRRWALKFGPAYARRLRRRPPSRRDIWHLDEVVVTIAGQKHWLWRAVDQDGYMLDEVIQTRRNTTAAKRLLKRLLRKQGCPPRRMITDKLGSYAAARSQIMPEVEHRSHKGLLYSADGSQAQSDGPMPGRELSCGLLLLFGFGTMALPSWGRKNEAELSEKRPSAPRGARSMLCFELTSFVVPQGTASRSGAEARGSP
jgi:putative transposase